MSTAPPTGKGVANIELPEVREVLRQSDKFIWIGLHEPGEHILQQVQNEFGLHDLAIRINEMIDNTRELLGTALEANFSLISISQSEVGKKFAGWVAIIGVPTMIAGIYGMNFHFMPGLDWDYGFEVVLALTLGSCGGLFIFFRRAGWL